MDKKEAIKALEAHFSVKATYLGVPSFAYAIRTETESYVIDNAGTVRDSAGTEIAIDALLESGKEAATDFIGDYEVAFPLEGHTGTTLQNIVNMLTSKEKLIAKAFNLKVPLIDVDLAEDLSHLGTGTISDFKAAWLAVGPDRCPGIRFDFEKETVTFKLVSEDLDQVKKSAFTDLVTLVNRNARILKYASFKPAQEDNPKFGFRTWLTRLGMIGSDYKKSRKFLIANLEGNSAFRTIKDKPIADNAEGTTLSTE